MKTLAICRVAAGVDPTAVNAAELGKLIPFIADKTAIDGRATAYVCARGRCELPVFEPEALATLLARRVPYPAT